MSHGGHSVEAGESVWQIPAGFLLVFVDLLAHSDSLNIISNWGQGGGGGH